MLKDVIEFIVARTQLSREDALRETNYAWREIWNSDDLPNSLFEITTTPIDNTARISLPWYVGKVRGAKQALGYGRERIVLNTPRPWYQDDTYSQSSFTWRQLGTSPLMRSITNASTLSLSFTEPVTAPVKASLIGPNDNGSNVREEVLFTTGETNMQSILRFTDLNAIAKDVITETDLLVRDASGTTIAIVPNSEFEARNEIVQITDKCMVCCSWCRCFDILYKRTAPYLHFDETPIPNQEVLMTKTLEWILLPKDGQENKAVMFGTKSRELLTGYNTDERSTEHKMDIGLNKFNKRYVGHL